MNKQEIKDISAFVQAAAVPYDWPEAFAREVALHLRPLPFRWAMRNARLWAARPNLDERGREQPKFLNDLASVLKAVGVPLGARDALARAAVTPGALMIPDLRSVDDLTYVGPDDPLPQGCYEYLVVNRLPVPPRPVAQAALGPARALPSGERGMTAAEVLARVRAARRATPAARAPRAPEAREVLAILRAKDDLPPGLVHAIERLVFSAEAQRAGWDEQREIDEERAAALGRAFVGAGDDAEGYCDAIGRLTRSLVGLVGPSRATQAFDAVARAVLPSLPTVRIALSHRDPLDPESPVSRVVVDCRPDAPPAPSPARTPPPGPVGRAPRRFGQV